jgi:ABC-2 type transport system ATP-binding protein
MSILIDNVTKSYGKKTAVDGLTLSVAPGELYAFLGPNGAGKTTTMKVTTGLLRPTSGTVSVCGHDVHTDGIAARKVISYVPDQPFLYDKLTGREFLFFVGRMYGMEPDACARRIERVSKRFDTLEYIDELAEGYSHGMKQRIVLSAAILHDPRVLVIDEPMVGLDPRSGRLVKNVLREMVEDGVTVFMSTHTLSIAEEVADRVGIIYHGRLVGEGTVDELRSRGHTSGRLEDVFLTLTSGPAEPDTPDSPPLEPTR